MASRRSQEYAKRRQQARQQQQDKTLQLESLEHRILLAGNTSTEITLEPGEHTLQMLLGDHLHIPHDPPLASDVITITVEASETVE